MSFNLKDLIDQVQYKSTDNVLKNTKKELEELSKKEYILEILRFAEDFGKEYKEMKKRGIDRVDFVIDYEWDNRKYEIVKMKICENRGEVLSLSDVSFKLRKPSQINTAYCNESLLDMDNNKIEIKLKLDNNIKMSILETFLKDDIYKELSFLFIEKSVPVHQKKYKSKI